jgi:hypothetical protein
MKTRNPTVSLPLGKEQVLRNHCKDMPDYRQRGEAARLSCSQLLIALRHVKFGGSIVVLMHIIFKWHTILTIRAFDQFSNIEIFKPLSGHKARGSFYLIAKNVKPEHPEALKAIEYWTDCWKNVTLYAMTHEGREDDVATPGNKIGDEVDDKTKDMGPDQKVKNISRRDDIDEKEKIHNGAEEDDDGHHGVDPFVKQVMTNFGPRLIALGETATVRDRHSGAFTLSRTASETYTGLICCLTHKLRLPLKILILKKCTASELLLWLICKAKVTIIDKKRIEVTMFRRKFLWISKMMKRVRDES